MRLASRPETLIMKDFLIPPNCLRFVETSKAGTTSRKLDRVSRNIYLYDIAVYINSFAFYVVKDVEHVNIRT